MRKWKSKKMKINKNRMKVMTKKNKIRMKKMRKNKIMI